MRTIIGILAVASCAIAAVASCTDDSNPSTPAVDGGNVGLDATAGDGGSSTPESGATTDAQTQDAAPDGGSADSATDAGTEGGCNNASLIQSTFTKCDASPGNVGQLGDAPGVTCNEVCCTFGFSGCAFRAAQFGLTACDPPNPGDSGLCTDVFQTTWSSQCVCSP